MGRNDIILKECYVVFNDGFGGSVGSVSVMVLYLFYIDVEWNKFLVIK